MSRSAWYRSAILAAGVLVSTAHAQWLPQGNPVCRVPEGLFGQTGVSRVNCATYCGATFDLFWEDGRNGFGSIYRGQLSDFVSPPAGPEDVPGVLVRQINGFLNPVAAIPVYPVQPVLTQFPRTATILVWNENQSSIQAAIRAQRLDDLVDWGPDGVAIVTNGRAARASSASVAPDDSGGVFVAWSAGSPITNNPQTWLQRVDANGQLRFGPNGIFLGPDTTLHGDVYVADDGGGGCYVARAARDSLSLIYRPVFVNAVYHFDHSGQSVAGWPSSGIRMGGDMITGLVACPPLQTVSQPPPPPAGVWLIKAGFETVGSISSIPSVRVSWIAANGSIPPAWSGPDLTVISGRNADVLASKALLGPRSDLYVLTQVKARFPVESPTLEDLALQRVALTGGLAAGWPAAGVTVCDAPGRQSQANMVAVGDGVLCAWKDERVSSGDIYASRVLGNASRAAEWPVNGLRVCDAPGMQYAPVLGPNLVGGAFIAWLDQRDFATHSDDLYGQTVSGDARLSVDPRTTVPFALAPVRPNPAQGAVQLRLDLPAESDVVFEVFDLTGRVVHRALQHAGPGTSTLGWDLRTDTESHARPGLYLMRVRAGTHEAHARVVVTQ